MNKHLDFEEVWDPVRRVIKHNNMGYGAAVTLGSQFAIMKSELEKLYGENKRYREALEFYADKKNYEVWDVHADHNESYINRVDYDEGFKARKALEESK